MALVQGDFAERGSLTRAQRAIPVEQPHTAVGHAWHEIAQYPSTCKTCREESELPCSEASWCDDYDGHAGPCRRWWNS